MGAPCGLYACAALVCVHQLLRPSGMVVPSPVVLAIVFLATTAIYAIDRVKLFARSFDPADVAAEPRRYHFLAGRRELARAFAVLFAIAAIGLAMQLGAVAVTVVIAAVCGGIVYAPRARDGRARIKDVLWIKNAFTAVGLAAFVTYFASIDRVFPSGTADFAPANWAALISAAGLVGGRVFLDAALCDLDDERTDRVFGTRTLCTEFGSMRVWRCTGVARVVLLAACVLAGSLSMEGRVSWAVAMGLGMLALRVRKPRRVRQIVDGRLMWEAMMTTGVLLVARSFG
ncbi:MAG: hypothetical protein JSS51_08220 [Planctomycetes bacterium]|nr:hypothetical protein [Planctomycetota bacterium]